MQALHLRVVEVFAVGRGDREQVTPRRFAAIRCARRIELPAHLLEQQREVLLVLGPVRDTGHTLAGIFPVEIEAVRAVRTHQGNCAPRECFPRGRAERGIRKSVRLPSADGNQDSQSRILLLQRDQGFQHRREGRILEHDFARGCDACEGEIDVRQLFGVYHRRRRPAGDVGDDAEPIGRRSMSGNTRQHGQGDQKAG